MSKVALLVGVSKYPVSDPLPKAQKDVEVLEHVLKQPKFEFETVETSLDCSSSQIQEAIETFFKHRRPEDQVVFLFSGYVIQEKGGALYFATPETALDEQGRLIKARNIPVRFVQGVMNNSPAQYQVVILNCCFWQTFGNNAFATTDNLIDWQMQLGGEGRVILTASTWAPYLTKSVDLDVWSYSQYLAEGIETSAADANSSGILTPDDLHNYVKRKLRVAAPAMEPQLYGSKEVAKYPFLEVPVHDPAVRYRKVLEDLVEQGESDVTASTLLTHRSLLDDVQHALGLPPEEAAEMEFQTLQPLRDYRQRLQFYEDQLSEIASGQDVLSFQSHLHLKHIQKALGLTDSDTAAIDATPYIAGEQYQKNLASYEQILLAAMRRQFPLAEGDRYVLQRLQQALQLREVDVKTTETKVEAQLKATEVVNHLKNIVYRFALKSDANKEERLLFKKNVQVMKQANPAWVVTQDLPRPNEVEAVLVMFKDEDYPNRYAAYFITSSLSKVIEDVYAE